MKTTLEDRVTLWKVAAFAEVAMLEPRPELQRLCRAAEGNVLTPDGIETVLPGLSESGRRNLTTYCRYLGLIDDVGRLTDAGRHCLQTGEAPALEQGVYTFWLADHTAFGIEVIHLRREQPDPFDRNMEGLESVEHLLKDAFKLWGSVVSPKQRFILRSLPGPKNQPPLGRIAEPAGQCRIQWEFDLSTGANRRWLEGRLEHGEGESKQLAPFRKELPPLPQDEVLRLFPRWDARWSAERGYLAIDYDGLAGTHGRDTFRRAYRYKQVEVPKQGTFQNIQVRDVPVGPASAQGARDWAFRLLLARVLASEGYLTGPQLQEMFSEGVKGTPLEPFSPAEPTTDLLLRDLESAATPEALHAGWRLAAPLDLSWQP